MYALYILFLEIDLKCSWMLTVTLNIWDMINCITNISQNQKMCVAEWMWRRFVVTQIQSWLPVVLSKIDSWYHLLITSESVLKVYPCILHKTQLYIYLARRNLVAIWVNFQITALFVVRTEITKWCSLPVVFNLNWQMIFVMFFRESKYMWYFVLATPD